MRLKNGLGILTLALLLAQCASPLHRTTAPSGPTGVPTASPPAPTSTPLQTGHLVILTDPPGASVWVDRSPQEGVTPWEGDLPPGRHDLELTLPGYKKWPGQVDMAAGDTITVEVPMQSCFRVLFSLGKEPGKELAFLGWEADGRALRYAFEDRDLPSEEPKDWTWYRYNLLTDEVEALPPPPSHVSDEVRAELGLCPLDRRQAEGLCRLATVLYEAPSGTHMVYAPPEVVCNPAGGIPCLGVFNLWHADVQGENRVFLGRPRFGGEGGRPGLIWSPREDWVLIDVTYEIGDFYLARVDGTFFEHFFPVPIDPVSSGEVSIYLSIHPSFSPDGGHIAFIGTKEGRHATWVMALDGSNHVWKVSDHIGLLQWSPDAHYLYIFDIVGRTLYRVEPAEMSPREEIMVTGLPLYEGLELGYEKVHLGFGSPGWQFWALSPDETKIVYRGVGEEWGVVEIAPECISR